MFKEQKSDGNHREDEHYRMNIASASYQEIKANMGDESPENSLGD
jgi:hypothetical protein